MNYLNYLVILQQIDRLFDLYTGGPRRPVFFDIEKTCPQLLKLDENSAAIRKELLPLLPQKRAIPRYHELDETEHYISAKFDPDKDWRVFYLYAMGEKPEANRARCPETSALLDRIPCLMQAFFSILDGGKSVPRTPGPVSRLHPLPPRAGRPRAGPALDPDQGSTLHLAVKAKASSSMTVGTTRCTTRATATGWS